MVPVVVGDCGAVGLGFGLLLIANRRRRLGDDRWLRLLRRLALVLWLGSAVGLVVLVATTPFFDEGFTGRRFRTGPWEGRLRFGRR